MGRREPQFVLYAWIDGKKQWILQLDKPPAPMPLPPLPADYKRPIVKVTKHTVMYWEAMRFTKYKADFLATDLNDQGSLTYEIEPA